MKKSGRIYHKIAEDILELIDSDDFPVGSRLPSERELALKFNVSRGCIRKAQIVLEAQGRLKVKASAGVFVCNKNLPNPKCFEIIEAHGLFAAEVAALAAPLITDDIIKELEALAPIITGEVESEVTSDEALSLIHI